MEFAWYLHNMLLHMYKSECIFTVHLQFDLQVQSKSIPEVVYKNISDTID